MADETTRLYVVTAAAGLLVAGRMHGGAGSTLSLTETEARYELMLETIVPDGTVVVAPPPPAVVSPIDRLEALRGGRDYDFMVSDLTGYLAAMLASAVYDQLRLRLIGNADDDSDDLGKLADRLDALGFDTASIIENLRPLTQAVSTLRVTTIPALDARLTALLGSADSAHDSLGKVGALVEATRASLAQKADTAVLQAIAVAILDAVDASKLDRAPPAYADRAAALAAIAPGTMIFAEVGGRFSCFRNRAGVLVEPFATVTDHDA